MSSGPPPQQSAASRRIVVGTIGKPVAATVALTVSATVQVTAPGDTMGNHGNDDVVERPGNIHEDGDGLGLCDAEQGSTKFAKRRSLSV
jgi:hypothetical protein